MRAFRRLSIVSTSTIAVVIALAILSVAQTTEPQETTKTPPKIRIKNFGSINETFFRGAQPKEQDYADLAAMGIKTVIDLQRNGHEEEQSLVEAQGMKFFRIPMSDSAQPAPGQAEEFLKLVNDPANHPVFVHCAGGRHRTGAMSAIYRITRDGWSADQAYLEMKRYDFEYGMGHGSLKRYVYEFYSKLDEKPVVADTNK
jgi:tyrosine-protein phosphatase SIW14